MSRRTDPITAEKVSIVLLTNAAFGTEAGLRAALLYGVNPALLEAVFQRLPSKTRSIVAETGLPKGRRKDER